MAKKKKLVPVAAPTVDHPQANQKADVLQMGMANYGALCRCEGQVQQPEGDFFSGLYLRVGRGSVTYTSQEVVNAPDAIWNEPGSGFPRSWSVPNQLIADCNSAGTADNTLHAVTLSYSYNGMGWDMHDEMTAVPFDGEAVTSCSSSSGMPLSAARAAAAPAAIGDVAVPVPLIPAAGDPVGPSDADGDWLLYQGLSVSKLFFGNLLMRDGQPLRARVLAVAADAVDWSYEIPVSTTKMYRQHVRRPVGDLKFDSSTFWRFSRSPRNGIVLWQCAFEDGAPVAPALPEQVIASTSRTAPDLIHLRDHHLTFAQVNYFLPVVGSLNGAFSLWVKVID